MDRSIEEQKERFLGDVAALHHNFVQLNNIQKIIKSPWTPEIKVALAIFHPVVRFLRQLLWLSLIIDLGWLYDKKGQRSLYWFMKKVESGSTRASEIKSRRQEIKGFESKIKRIRTLRNKWVAHKDADAYANIDQWITQNKVTVEEIEPLVTMAAKIIQLEADATTSEIHLLFNLGEVIASNPDFLSELLNDGRFVSTTDKNDIQELCDELKKGGKKV